MELSTLQQICRNKETSQTIEKCLKERGFISHLKANLWSEIYKEPHVSKDGLELLSKRVMWQTGFDSKLKNAVYCEIIKLSQTGLPNHFISMLHDKSSKETVDYIRDAQQKWNDKLRRSLTALSVERKLSFIKERSQSEREKLEKKWNAISTLKYDNTKLHPIYSPKDFLHFLQTIKNPNSCLIERYQYRLLHPSKMESTCSIKQGPSKAIKSGLCLNARQSCQTGCPIEYRSTLWNMALGIDCSLPQHSFQFKKLKLSVLKDQLLIDDLVIEDVKRTAANDVEYFVFEDTIYQILMTFFRDKDLPTTVSSIHDYSQEDYGQRSSVYQINGIIPFHGFSMYVAPLCYLQQKTELLYVLFKNIYTRYFYHLNNMSSHEQGILCLCDMFETLMISKLPELFQYLTKIEVHPLRLAFPWLVYAFSGVLSTEQVLLLWDLIIGYDSLEILPLLAVAIFEFRAKTLFHVHTMTEAEAVLSDVSTLSIMPLLQHTLFL